MNPTSFQEPRRTVHFVDPSIRTPELDIFNYWSARSPIRLSFHLPVLMGFSSLNLISEHREPVAGIVIMGSAASVNDGDRWIQCLVDWLEPQISAGTPILGLCFGHQLIAKMFGGEVRFMSENHAKVTGLRSISLLAQPRLKIPKTSGELVVSHAEAVFSTPPGFDVLATSLDVVIDGLVHHKLPIWTFQSHPEATLGFLLNQGIEPAKILNNLSFGHGIVMKFLEFCSQHP